ncbi:hypothetical protein [Mesorhizobium sp. ANAO-SY3R2]|uniref:hypothetical protein n=1 Tax=Mesorhizobium sp. ANAO-SY3R2 TaxID=3166644 RepID=UPI0036730590
MTFGEQFLDEIAQLLAKAAAKAEEFGDEQLSEKVNLAFAEAMRLSLKERTPQARHR